MTLVLNMLHLRPPEGDIQEAVTHTGLKLITVWAEIRNNHHIEGWRILRVEEMPRGKVQKMRKAVAELHD